MEKRLGEKKPRKAASLFGKYQLLRSLKRSPFLESYLAQAESPPHTVVVLKRLHPLVIHRTDWVSLFLEEAKQAAALWHPNIIRIYDLGEADGIPYFVQPYLFGKKLQTLLARSRSLPIPTGMALLLVRQLLEALQFVHGLRGRCGKPIVHGGLHPERVFIGYDGGVGVGDFGLGWLEDPRSAVRSRYRAPESISEKKGGEIAAGTVGDDLFAASAILCELLGEFPEPVKPGMEPWGYLPAPLRSILVRGLAIEPSARFQTAGEMIEPIASVLRGDYPRLNLSNYIQAFFGKEIEAERRAFARFAPRGGEGPTFGEPLLFERLELPAVSIPGAPVPPDRSQAPAATEPPAVVETRVPLPAHADRPDGERAHPPPQAAPEKKGPSWQPIWWGLFGLLTTGFVGVLLFSLYRSSSDKVAPAPPTPLVEARRDPIDPPSSPAEESAASNDRAPAVQKESPPLAIAERPVLPPAQAPASTVEFTQAPPSPGEKPQPGEIKKPAVTSASDNDLHSIPAPPPGAPADASPAATETAPTSRRRSPPPPKVEVIPSPKSNEQMLHELIERQRRAYQSQDWALSRLDVADGRAFDGQLTELFGGVEPVRVEFEIFGLKVRGDEADLSLMQTARVRKGNALSLQKALLFWKLKKEKEQWKIERFNVIEKYPPVDAG